MSLCFALRPGVFQIIEVFGFPIGYNGKFQKCIKNQNFKNPKQYFFEDHWEEKVGEGKIQKWTEVGVAFWNIWLP